MAGLPKRLTIYRGGSRERLHEGWSWTSDHKVAHHFAFDRARCFGGDPRVISAHVPSWRVLAIWPGHHARDEQEIVVAGVEPDGFRELTPRRHLARLAERAFAA